MTDHLQPKSDACVVVNGKSTLFTPGLTLRKLIESLGMGQQAVAAEVNGTLVRRSQHETTLLRAGDKIELVSLVGGG
jgi:sulfur carrier protein